MLNRGALLLSLTFIVGTATMASQTAVAASEPSFIIVGARVADGTGAPLREISVRVAKGRILEIGALTPRVSETVVAGSGFVLAPGFIDIHNHSTSRVLDEPAATSQVSQGITTIVVGQDGSSLLPVSSYFKSLRKTRAAVNVATCVGHATVRRSVMGEGYKRIARPDEVARMAAIVDRAFKEGAICLSSGLEYEVGGYASTDEIVALARVAGRHGAFYISHIRDEADKSIEAMTELVEIGERGKVAVQNTHIKVGTASVWGKAAEVLRMFDAARQRGVDVTADCYPWEAWSSTMLVLVPNKRYDDAESVARGLADVGGAHNVLVTSYDKDTSFEFRTLAEIAATRGLTPVALFSEMARNGGASVVVKSMMDEDIRAFYAWPWTMVSSDGGIEYRHPRGAGTFPRVLGRFVRERGWLSLEEAIRKMTSLPAWRLGLKDRGRVAAGYVADLVLFDPATVIDNATFTEPFRLSTGIVGVWVSGERVWEAGQSTVARPGRVLSATRK
jgi:N-acyl-D-amino-acid deacylase